MNKKEIIKAIRSKIDTELKELGFAYKSKEESYVKFDKETQLYFEISLLFFDGADYKNATVTKYVELYVNVYHQEVSNILLETSTRSFLGSMFYFKVAGNLLADIILNPNISDYTSRNNSNYFKLFFAAETECDAVSLRMLDIIKQYAIPFFKSLASLDDIMGKLDQSYESTLSIHNVNNERLLALIVLLLKFKDEETGKKIEKIRAHFLSIDHSTALVELDNILAKCS